MKQSRIYTKEILEQAVSNCISFSEVCKYLGKRNKGAIYELIRNRIRDYGINTDHFLGQAAYGGKRNPHYEKRASKEEILTDGYKYRASHRSLKRALLESGILYKCSVCSLKTWLDSPITLDIDHIDGNWKNCKLSNLRFLCPNCHRQTDTFAGKNNTKQKLVKDKKVDTDITNEEIIFKRRTLLENSKIDFQAFGCFTKAGIVLGLSPQHTKRWIRKYIPEIELFNKK